MHTPGTQDNQSPAWHLQVGFVQSSRYSNKKKNSNCIQQIDLCRSLSGEGKQSQPAGVPASANCILQVWAAAPRFLRRTAMAIAEVRTEDEDRTAEAEPSEEDERDFHDHESDGLFVLSNVVRR